MSTVFRSLRHRNARLWFAGLIASNAGTWLQSSAQAWLVFQLTDSGLQAGLVVAVQFLPMLVFGPWAGVLADRSDRYRIVMWTQSLAGLQALALGVASLTGHISLTVIYALTLVLGFVNAIDNPARRSMVSELVEADELANAMALNTAVMTGSRIIGPALGALLIGSIGAGWCFVINGISYLAVLGALTRMDRAAIHKSTPAPHRKGQVLEGWRFVWSVRPLAVTFSVLLVVSTFAFNNQTTMPPFVRRIFDHGPTAFGLLLAVTSVGSLLGSLITAGRKNATTGYLLTSAAALGVFMTLMAFAPTLWLAFVLAVPMGAAGAAFIATSSGLLLQAAPPDMRGRLLALQGTAFLGSTPIGSPLVGWALETFGARWGLGVGGVATLVALGLVPIVRRRVPAPVAEPVPVVA